MYASVFAYDQVLSQTVATVGIKCADTTGPWHSQTLETFCQNESFFQVGGVH